MPRGPQCVLPSTRPLIPGAVREQIQGRRGLAAIVIGQSYSTHCLVLSRIALSHCKTLLSPRHSPRVGTVLFQSVFETHHSSS